VSELSVAEIRHNQAVAQSLAWARAAAARGEFADALGWLQVVEAVGHVLSPDEQRDRRHWLRAVRGGPSLPTRRDRDHDHVRAEARP
jgi:hypothetical protein